MRHARKPQTTLRAALAKQFVGFTGSPKAFREMADKVLQRTAVLDTDGKAKYHREYTHADIRAIRKKLLNIPEVAHNTAMPPIIVNRMTKGGTGKTTIAVNVAHILAMSGFRVLFIDADSQATATTLFGIDWTKEGLEHILTLIRRHADREPVDLDAAIFPMFDGHMLDVIAADITMADESWLAGISYREQRFQRLLDDHMEFFGRYDVIIIDCAPGSSLLSTCVMVAGSKILSVVTPEPKSITALDVLASNIKEINDDPTRKTTLGSHIICNRFALNRAPHKEWLGILAAKYKSMMSDVLVMDCVGFMREEDPDDVTKNAPLIEREPNSSGSKDILALTKELVKVYDIRLAGVQTDPMQTNPMRDAA